MVVKTVLCEGFSSPPLGSEPVMGRCGSGTQLPPGVCLPEVALAALRSRRGSPGAGEGTEVCVRERAHTRTCG